MRRCQGTRAGFKAALNFTRWFGGRAKLYTLVFWVVFCGVYASEGGLKNPSPCAPRSPVAKLALALRGAVARRQKQGGNNGT
jgi:hypothetical protein